jgi:glycerophosphoryl diester phosphodiesterase/HEAT repeat protein
MKPNSVLLFLSVACAFSARAATLQTGRVELLCHRTASEDVPENTLESLEQAALLGCNVVEIDLRRTLDGKIVLNHDGILERLTDGAGEVETSYYDDLRLRDAGGWMGDRFSGMHIALFEDALRLARQQDIRLILDIKTRGIGVDVLELLQREGMLERVQFHGEWDDIKKLDPGAPGAGDATIWVQPGVTPEQVKSYHREGKAVVANFSDNGHEMDLSAMKAAVTAGVDGINVDYPRLGVDAVGRPVERRLNALVTEASTGESSTRAKAILELSRYRGFNFQEEFAHWLLDPEDRISRAAAVALVLARPQPPAAIFAEVLRSANADARANAAWALGMLGAPADILLPLLQDKNPHVLQEALLALARAPGDVSADMLLPLLKHQAPTVRGAAVMALARHQPDAAFNAIPAQLRLEMKAAAGLSEDYARRGSPNLSPAEIDEFKSYFGCEMKMVQAISMLKRAGAMQVLEEQAFQSDVIAVHYVGIVATFQLWDRIGQDADSAVQALGSPDSEIADRTEWMLVQAGPAVLPEVRRALTTEHAELRERAIRILAWQGDAQSLETLRNLQKTDRTSAALITWAIEKIELLHPAFVTSTQK